jgi:hypothetical protein
MAAQLKHRRDLTLRHPAPQGGHLLPWTGGIDEDSVFYHRVHSPVMLIEFDHLRGIALDNEKPSRTHIHAVVRMPNGNGLRQGSPTPASPAIRPHTAGKALSALRSRSRGRNTSEAQKPQRAI